MRENLMQTEIEKKTIRRLLCYCDRKNAQTETNLIRKAALNEIKQNKTKAIQSKNEWMRCNAM